MLVNKNYSLLELLVDYDLTYAHEYSSGIRIGLYMYLGHKWVPTATEDWRQEFLFTIAQVPAALEFLNIDQNKLILKADSSL